MAPEYWEVIEDRSDYCLYTVRQVAHDKFTDAFHLMSKDEAVHLAELLNALEAFKWAGEE